MVIVVVLCSEHAGLCGAPSSARPPSVEDVPRPRAVSGASRRGAAGDEITGDGSKPVCTSCFTRGSSTELINIESNLYGTNLIQEGDCHDHQRNDQYIRGSG